MSCSRRRGVRLEQTAGPGRRAGWPFGSIRATDVRSLGGPVLDVEVPAGAELVREGSVVRTFCVIRAGAVRLTREGEVLERLGVGGCFGEVDPRSPAPQPYGVRERLLDALARPEWVPFLAPSALADAFA
jgi:CRP-like cAMP-binding protein